MIDESWPFEDAKNVMVITTKNVIKNNKLIAYVSHDEEDGMWQFHDVTNVKMEDAMIVSLLEIVVRDKTIKELYDLPLGWIARRNTTDKNWKRQPRNS